MAESEKNVQTSFLDYCEVCDVKLKNAFMSDEHMNGKRHKRQVITTIALKGEVVKRERERAKERAKVAAKEGSAKVAAKEKENTTNPGMKRNAEEKNEHPATKKIKTEDAEESLSCRTCDKVFKTDWETLEHFKGNFHKSKLFEAKLPISEQPSTSNKSHEEDSALLTCNDCVLVFHSESLALQHFKGKSHATKVLRNAEEKAKSKAANQSKPEECTICSRKFYNDDFAALVHYKSKGHKEKLLASVGAIQPKGNPDKVNGNPDKVKGNPDKVEGNPDKVNGNPDKVKGNPDKVKGNPDKVKGNPDKEGKMYNANIKQSVPSKQPEAKEKSKNTSNTTSKNWSRNNSTSNTTSKNLSSNNSTSKTTSKTTGGGGGSGGGGYGYKRIENNFDKGRQTSSNSRPNINENNTNWQQKARYVFDKRPMSSNINLDKTPQDSFNFNLNRNPQSSSNFNLNRNPQSSSNFNLDRNPQSSSNFTLNRNPQSSSNFNLNKNSQSSYEQRNGIFNSSEKLLGRNSYAPQSNYRDLFASQSNYHPQSSSLQSGNMPYFDPSTARLSNISNDILRLKSMLRGYDS